LILVVAGGCLGLNAPAQYTGGIAMLTSTDINAATTTVTATKVITGLPNSNHDHVVNSLEFDDNGIASSLL
jgi:hypothetical protein